MVCVEPFANVVSRTDTLADDQRLGELAAAVALVACAVPVLLISARVRARFG